MIALGLIVLVLLGVKVFACVGMGMVLGVARPHAIANLATDASDPVTTSARAVAPLRPRSVN